MIARAKLKYLGVSPQKTRLVIDQVRGQNVGEALNILRHSPKSVAPREAATPSCRTGIACISTCGVMDLFRTVALDWDWNEQSSWSQE